MPMDCKLLFSHLVVSNSSWPHGPEHARPSCLPLPPRVGSNSCWELRWHCPAISSSVVPFSSCLHTFPTSGSFPGSLLFSWDGQRIGASASGCVLLVSTQAWFPSEWKVQPAGNWMTEFPPCLRLLETTYFSLTFLSSPLFSLLHFLPFRRGRCVEMWLHAI